MATVVIENPILNAPFAEPSRHFKFGDQGITGEIRSGRQERGHLPPIRKRAPKAVRKLSRDKIEVRSYVGGLVQSFERKAA